MASIGLTKAQKINWESDLTNACQKAEQAEKLVLVHFTASWSRRCQNVNSFIFTNPTIIRQLNTDVIPILIDVDQNPQLTVEFGVHEVPSDIVLTPGKKLVMKRKSPTETNSYSAIFSHIQKTNELISEHGLESVDATISQTQDRAQKIIQATSAGDSLRLSKPVDMLERPSPLIRPQDRMPGVAADQVQAHHTPVAKDRLAGRGMKVKNQFFDPQQVLQSFDANELTRNPTRQSVSVLNPETNTSATNLQASMLLPSEDTVSPTTPKVPSPVRILNANFTARHSNDPEHGRLTAATMQPNLKWVNDNEVTGQQRVINHHLPKLEEPSAVVSPSATRQEETSPMLLGNCPVTLLKMQKWVPGDRRWGSFHRNRLYLFVDQTAMSEFLQDPEFYSPLLSGYDPVQFAQTGELVAGKESLGVFLGTAPNQRIALFSNRQNRLEFETNPAKYLEAIAKAID